MKAARAIFRALSLLLLVPALLLLTLVVALTGTLDKYFQDDGRDE